MKLRTALLGRPDRAAHAEGDRHVIFGMPFNPLNTDEAADALSACLATGQRGITVFTPDAHASAMAMLDPTRQALYEKASFVLCDGAGMAWASRCLRQSVPRAPGVDVAWALCRRAQRRGWGVYLLGGRPGVAQAAARHLETALPGLRVVGVHHGYAPSRRPQNDLANLKPELVFVGMGCPKQERWILDHRTTGAGILMGVGGAIDLWAGLHPRAPLAWRRCGVEWAWRAFHQPSRARRLWAVPFLLYHTALATLRTRARD